MPDNEDAAPAAEAQQNLAQASDGKAEATGAAKASNELSHDDLEALAGGVVDPGQGVPAQGQSALGTMLSSRFVQSRASGKKG